ncbi:MAG: TPM domain-containing protein [Acidobacteria bacterium]|nr:TPM domain-containing protein [Acidobacteriota bacterium]
MSRTSTFLGRTVLSSRTLFRSAAASTLLLILLFLFSSAARAQVPQEKPQGYINDLAGVLSPEARQQLEALAAELQQKTGAQMAVVTVQSLEGESLEIFVNDLATRWGVGDKQDRGILLFLAIEDRRNHIEVGYGLEPIITDARSGDILRAMTPHLRTGDYDNAIAMGMISIAQIIAEDSGVTLNVLSGVRPQGRTAVSSRGGLRRLLPMFFLLPFLLFSRRGRYGHRRGGWYGMPLYGAGMMMGRGLGGFSGGGGGFGGFGGGGFGGGGASGSW